MNLLPKELIGTLLTYTTVTTARSLSHTCSALRSMVNSVAVFNILGSVDSPEHVAAMLNTFTSRQFLWNYIQSSGDFETYQSIQDIRAVVLDIIQKLKNAGFVFNVETSNLRFYNFTDRQSQKGFKLYLRSGLLTPFGEIKILPNLQSNQLMSRLRIALIHRLGSEFEMMKQEEGAIGNIYEYSMSLETVFDKDSLLIENSPTFNNLKDSVGSKKLFVSNYFHFYSIYSVKHVDGNPVPEFQACEKPRSMVLIKRIWEMLELNEKGFDPVTKKIS